MIPKQNLLNNMLFWLTLILIVIFFFPKSCGTIPKSTVVDFKCTGLNNIFKTELYQNNSNLLGSNKTKVFQIWCSGICIEKSKNINQSLIKQNNTSSAPSEVSDMASDFKAVLPKLFLILILIALIAMIINYKKSKKRGGSTTVIRGP